MAARKKPQTDPETAAPPARGRKKAAPPADGVAKAPVRRKKAPAAAEAVPEAGPRGKHDLVIVESPAKAKTINKYLGADFKVLASYGHVRDLPRRRKQGRGGRRHRHRRRLGADLRRGRRATRTARAASGRRTPKDILAELKREAAKAEPRLPGDRPRPRGRGHRLAHRGRAEARRRPHVPHHLQRDHQARRCSTRCATPARSTWTACSAQEARRILDRVVGYPL